MKKDKKNPDRSIVPILSPDSIKIRLCPVSRYAIRGSFSASDSEAYYFFGANVNTLQARDALSGIHIARFYQLHHVEAHRTFLVALSAGDA